MQSAAFCGQLCHEKTAISGWSKPSCLITSGLLPRVQCFFLQSVCKFIQALGLPPPPMPNGAKFSPPGSNIQCFLSLLSLMFHLLEGLGVTAKSGPPLPQGRGKCLHLDCSNLKDARLITNFDGPPSNTDRTLNNPSQHVDTDESYTHMEGAPGLSGNLQTLPGQA